MVTGVMNVLLMTVSEKSHSLTWNEVLFGFAWFVCDRHKLVTTRVALAENCVIDMTSSVVNPAPLNENEVI